MGSHFIIRTDHRSLKSLLTQTIQTPEQHVFLCKLLGFDFSIIYKPGRENKVTDALSRSLEESEEEIIYTHRSKGEPGSFLAFSAPVCSLLEELREESIKCHKIQILMKKVQEKDEEARDYSIREGLCTHLQGQKLC